MRSLSLSVHSLHGTFPLRLTRLLSPLRKKALRLCLSSEQQGEVKKREKHCNLTRRGHPSAVRWRASSTGPRPHKRLQLPRTLWPLFLRANLQLFLFPSVPWWGCLHNGVNNVVLSEPWKVSLGKKKIIPELPAAVRARFILRLRGTGAYRCWPPAAWSCLEPRKLWSCRPHAVSRGELLWLALSGNALRSIWAASLVGGEPLGLLSFKIQASLCGGLHQEAEVEF